MVSDEGMYQRKVSITNAGSLNGEFIQFIMVDPGVTGDPTQSPFTAGRGSLQFTNEDFVKQNNQIGGISSKQIIIESTNPDPTTNPPTASTIENRIVLTTQYNFGWANGNLDPWVMVTQDIDQLD